MAIRAASRSGPYGGAYIRRLDTAEIAPAFARSGKDQFDEDDKPPNPFSEKQTGLSFASSGADDDEDDGTYGAVAPFLNRI